MMKQYKISQYLVEKNNNEANSKNKLKNKLQQNNKIKMKKNFNKISKNNIIKLKVNNIFAILKNLFLFFFDN